MHPSPKPMFEGLWLPMVTPMRGGHVDLDGAQALARYYRNAGIAGLVLFGSTGEGNLLSMPEKIEILFHTFCRRFPDIREYNSTWRQNQSPNVGLSPAQITATGAYPVPWPPDNRRSRATWSGHLP